MYTTGELVFCPPCACRSWAIPIIGPDEPVDERRRLPERCPDCGRTIPVRCIVVRSVDREG